MHISILGAGLTGLAAGYYAGKNELPFTIYEASHRAGGICATLKYGDFLFDTGAHRLHDKDAQVTEEVKRLLGEDLQKTKAPSRIYFDDRFIDFPLSPLNLLKNLGPGVFVRAIVEIVCARLTMRKQDKNFRSFALRTYGKTIAGLFLLNYSEKLWGIPCDRLSAEVAGKRLRNLGIGTLLREAIFDCEAKTDHLEGACFLYPKMGIGMIPNTLEMLCKANIRKNSQVSRVFCDNSKVRTIEINERQRINTCEVLSTLPINRFVQLLEPKPPEEILCMAASFRFRDLKLVVFILDKQEVIGEIATIYCNDPQFPFTRLYEPRNRSVHMSPPGKTSLVAEVPCHRGDLVWEMKDDELIDLVRSQVIRICRIKEEEIINATVFQIDNAYPVIEVDSQHKFQQIAKYLQRFSNLKICGRSGKFIYTSIHDAFLMSKEVIEGYDREK